MKVYLAGDLRTDWRAQVTASAPGHTYLNPQEHYGERDERTYTFLDLAQLDLSEVVFAYLTTANPSLYGTSLEVGYAKASGKQILLVDALADWRAPYFGMARSVADLVVPSLAEGIRLLNLLPKEEALS